MMSSGHGFHDLREIASKEGFILIYTLVIVLFFFFFFRFPKRPMS